MKSKNYKITGKLNLENEIKKIKENDKNKHKVTIVKVISIILEVFVVVIIANVVLTNLIMKISR